MVAAISEQYPLISVLLHLESALTKTQVAKRDKND